MSPRALPPCLAGARRGGWPAALGSALLLAAAIAWMLLLPRLDAAADAARSAADAARRRALAAPRQAAQPPPQPQPTAQGFVAALPGAAQRPQRVADLLALAARHGVQVRRSDFQLATDRDSGVDRYRATLPVSATYPALRAFLAAALQHDDALSLDGLKLQREHTAAAEWQAELRFTLFGRADLPEAGTPPATAPGAAP
jgi:hypothetical protein